MKFIIFQRVDEGNEETICYRAEKDRALKDERRAFFAIIFKTTEIYLPTWRL
jgi:hypothetical protein